MSEMNPEPDTRQRIVEGAAQVFSEQGYAGATTRAIAEAAGVNEVTIFRHFGSKQNLMQAVIAQFSAAPGLNAAFAGQLEGNLRKDLIKLGTYYLATMLKRRKAILMTLCAAERMPELREIVARPPAVQRQMLGQYLRRQIERGAVRPLPNPDLVAQAFFGALFEYAISQPLHSEPLQNAPEDVVTHLVDVFVQGIGVPENHVDYNAKVD